MTPAAKALWYIEAHSSEPLSLDDIAAVAGVSRFHLSRAFVYATGVPVVGYLRARRLSVAATALAAGAPDILAVALDAGYGSHEAFTRAFRDHFSLTPEAIRAAGHTNQLNLQEPLRMTAITNTLEPSRIVQAEARLVAGLSARYTDATSAGIPAQWQRFVPWLGSIPGQAGQATYGVICNTDDEGNTDYICGVEVAAFSRVPEELARLRLAAGKYAVFHHAGHVSAVQSTWNAIMNEWAPQAGSRIADAPSFERYSESFNPVTGTGGFEIWVPLEI